MPQGPFNESERRLVERLRTPTAVQQWLMSMPYNEEKRIESLRTLREVLRRKTAHCLEAAMCAATILEQHGHPPLVLDICSVDGLDHVLYLFRKRGRWGTVGRSRDPGLHGRKAVFRTVRDLVYSYYDPFIDHTGRIEGYGVRDLRDLDSRGVDWRLGRGDQWDVQDFLIEEPVRKIRGSDVRYERAKKRFLASKEHDARAKPVP